MPTALAATDSTYLLLEQAKQDFWTRNAHLSEPQRQELWLQTTSTLANNDYNAAPQHSMAQQIPRSMSYSTFNMSQLPNSELGSMDRTQSAPASVPMGRSISTLGADSANLQRSMSNMSNWQATHEEQPSDYALYSESASIRKPSLQPIAEHSTLDNDGMVEYTPDEYINSCIEPSSSPSIPLTHPQHPQQLHLQLTTNTEWSPPLDGSISPSTPSTALMTPVTHASNNMSRQSSFNPHFLDEVSMLRVQSDSSSMFPPLLTEDGSISFPFDVESKSISACVDNSHFLAFTGSPSENFLSPTTAPISAASAHALASSKTEPCLVEDMRRSASSSSESDASSASSASSSCSRQSRREREINAQAASRKIAPKAIESNEETKPTSSNVQMMRIRSEDGSSKDVGVITKAPYVRPQHPKIMCQYCNERPEGFRGTHELDRHVQRAHAQVRKGYICVDASANKKFLANCKHCRNKKVYGAYYNAAAHLRRAHFHPRKRGRKGKHDEKRGGIGGGDDPPMDFLKQHWIKEVEVENKPTDTKSVQSPESVSDSAEPMTSNFDSTPQYNIDAAYSNLSYTTVSQPESPLTSDMPTSMPNQIDPSQFMQGDMSMFVNTSEPMYDQSPQFAATYDPNSIMGDIHNFQFDAYMTAQ